MRKLTILLTLLTLSAGLAQAQSVFYYTATEKLESQFSKLGTVISHEFDVNTNTGTVKYSGNVVSIPTNSFWDCSELQSITLPACVTTIGSSAFGSCINLQSIDLSHVTYLGADAFNTCVELQSIDLSHVTTIEESAFMVCFKLQSIDLSHVTCLETATFAGCTNLQSITLSENLTEIKLRVFYGCPSLTDVTVAWTEADKILAINASVFNSIANGQGPWGATLHVPAGTKALYQAVDVWNTFGTIDDPASSYIAAAIAEIEAIATAAKAEIDDASTYEEAKTTQANYKSEIDATVSVAIYNINNATLIEIIDYEVLQATTCINQIKTEALAEIAKINALVEARADAIAAINEAIKDLTLFPAERQYIDDQISIINADEDINTIELAKQAVLEYIALHDAKVIAVAEVKHDMGDYAESEFLYNLIGGPAIEAATEADKITEAKNAALAKLEGISVILGDAYKKGKAEALGEMGEPCEDCPAVDVTKGTTTIRLYSPKKVEFRKME